MLDLACIGCLSSDRVNRIISSPEHVLMRGLRTHLQDGDKQSKLAFADHFLHELFNSRTLVRVLLLGTFVRDIFFVVSMRILMLA